MIRINLITEAQKGKQRDKAPRAEGSGAGAIFGQNVLMVGVVVLALLAVGWRW